MSKEEEFEKFSLRLPDNYLRLLISIQLLTAFWTARAAEKIAVKLKEKQMKQIMPVLKALVRGQKGPLVEGEIERTKDYARILATKLKEEKSWTFQ